MEQMCATGTERSARSLVRLPIRLGDALHHLLYGFRFLIA